jgi:coatomer subunit zeta
MVCKVSVKIIAITENNQQSNLSLYTVQGLIILDTEGHRVMAKYWTPAHHLQPELVLKGLTTVKDQRTFEKGLWEKTRKSSNGLL